MFSGLGNDIDDVVMAPLGFYVVDARLTVCAVQRCWFSASITVARASILASTATASSKSRSTWSTGKVAALAIIFGELPGTDNVLRLGRLGCFGMVFSRFFCLGRL
jgi:hypothetical protein